MGFSKTFGRKVGGRLTQYAIRETYKALPWQPSYSAGLSKSGGKSAGGGYSVRGSSGGRKSATKSGALDSEGKAYTGESFCVWKGKEYKIKEVKGKMVTFEDGTKHRASSVRWGIINRIEN